MTGLASLLPKGRECRDHLILSPNAVHVFTDGSCYPKDGTGGWGAVLVHQDTCVAIAGNKQGTTNNEMELSAILHGLNRVRYSKHPVLVYSDSQYSINAVASWWRGWQRKGWVTGQGKPVKNLELIQSIVGHDHYPKTAFQWVRGHAGHYFNEWADDLAGDARKQLYRDIHL